ncbi:hypothetical protein EZV62_019140 [Acer yangbiense]|uniref:Auxin response factor n=1 Tax=Acer yangbiense TaxID=1000413 RepID=A0A5C7HAC0_9ROSI|nr:hypothetical protein EZV62_019140 [Acer yangbiense]
MEVDKEPVTAESVGEDFTAVFDRDSECNLELWRALVGPQASLPKKGDVVVYFPQGHLEYAAWFPSLRPFSSTEAPTFDLQQQIICRVVHVQLIANKKNDEVCAHVTLLPEPEDNEQLDSPKVVAHDFHGTEWIFKLNVEDEQMKYSITRGWNEFVRDKHLFPGDTLVFLRGEDRELRLVLRRAGRCEIGLPESIIAKHYRSSDFLSPVADAILNESMFHLFYSPRASFADFLIPYEKCMKSITTTWHIGANFQMQYKLDDSLQRCNGVVIGMADLDPNKWPNSKWRCIMVSWGKDIDKNHKERVSPGEIVSDVRTSSSTINFPPQFKRPRIKAVESFTGFNKNPLPNTYLQEKSKHFILSVHQSMSRRAIMETLGQSKYGKLLKISKFDDQQIPLDPMVHDSLEYLEFDSCLFHSPTLGGYFPLTLKELKITNCVNPEHLLTVLTAQKGSSLKSLEIDGCSTLLSLPIDKLPATLRHLKMVNCMNLKSLSESVDIENRDSVGFGQVIDSNLVNMKSTSTLQLRHLVICDCPELEFLPEDLHSLDHLELLLVSNCSSLVSFPEGGLPNNSLIALLIYECESLKFLPNQLHKVISLQFLNISDCPSIMSFPEGGLPPNLVSLCIIDCENLVHLSHQGIHKLKNLKSYTFIGGHSDRRE